MSDFDYDVLVVGSGFGGSVTALRLTEKGYDVGVLECGKRWTNKTLPKSTWNIRKYLWLPRLGMRGIMRMSLLKDVMILSGSAVGGGSIVYANTLYEPLEQFWTGEQWADITDWRDELAVYYDQAKRMLGETKAHDTTPADDVMRETARRMGVGDSYHAARVGVYYGQKGVEVDDPFFGGEGPARRGCVECGACMIGCRHDAKNTLDRNYLYLAEKNGAVVHPERQVVDVIPLPGGGYEVVSARPGARVRKKRASLTAEHVVFSAGVLGTLKLLGSLKLRGRLPNLSDRLGELVRTNSEAILTAEEEVGGPVDYSQGIAITSSFHPNEITHVEPVRYPRGSTSNGLGYTMLTDGGKMPRQLIFLKNVLKNPAAFLRALSIRRWAERAVILLVMQARDNSLDVHFKLRRDGSTHLTTSQGHGEPNPTYIPEANDAARVAADVVDGEPRSSVFEVALDTPTTAHILGGCVIGSTPARGVVDAYQRVYGHPGLHVADASTISANLGVNPSLTITAQTERAMSFWPNKGEHDPRPPLGSEYERIDPVSPVAPSVPELAPAALAW